MKERKPLPTASQISHVRQLLAFRLFGYTAISRLTGVSLSDVFLISLSLPKPTDLSFPNPKKQLAEFFKRLLESV